MMTLFLPLAAAGRTKSPRQRDSTLLRTSTQRFLPPSKGEIARERERAGETRESKRERSSSTIVVTGRGPAVGYRPSQRPGPHSFPSPDCQWWRMVAVAATPADDSDSCGSQKWQRETEERTCRPAEFSVERLKLSLLTVSPLVESGEKSARPSLLFLLSALSLSLSLPSSPVRESGAVKEETSPCTTRRKFRAGTLKGIITSFAAL